MNDIITLTNKEFKRLWEEELLEEIDDKIDDSWRHGNNHTTVFQILSENNIPLNLFYKCEYKISGDGEYHGIREDEFKIKRVVPYTETITVTKWRNYE